MNELPNYTLVWHYMGVGSGKECALSHKCVFYERLHGQIYGQKNHSKFSQTLNWYKKIAVSCAHICKHLQDACGEGMGRKNLMQADIIS